MIAIGTALCLQRSVFTGEGKNILHFQQVNVTRLYCMSFLIISIESSRNITAKTAAVIF